MKKLLLILLLFTGMVNAQPPINNPTPYNLCDQNNDTFEIFDLSTKDNEILGSLNPLDVQITYHVALVDAQNGTNPILNYTSFTNYTFLIQTIYVRVVENTSGSFSTTSLDLVVNPIPIATQPSDLMIVDNPFDGVGAFDLTIQTPIILGSLSSSTYIVSYHETFTDAQTGANAIQSPYFNITFQQYIYARLYNQITNCFSTTSFKLIVNPFIINNPTPYILCDNDSNGLSSFDLNTKSAEILGSLSPSDYTLTYHETQANALLGNNSINLAFNYQNISPLYQTIWVRVVENANPSFPSIVSLQLVANPAPFIISPLPPLNVYENPADGVALFDLTLQANIILNGQTGLTISYYTSEANAMAQVAQLVNQSAYTGTHLQTIWINVYNNVTGCFTVTSFVLKVLDSALVVFIPDNNFKIKLLSASTGNTIAKDLGGNFTSVDTNSNGEIEFSEALNISYLDVSQSNIADMTGISSFTNLTYLDCRLNLVLNNLDVSNLTSLTYLNAYYAGLISLNLTPSIVNLDISANSLTGSLDLTTFTNLQTFKSGPYNGLTSLNLSGLTNLISVDCSFNNLTTLNVNGCSQLQTLNCVANLISNLNVAGLSSLLTFDSTSNQIPTLDLSIATNLQSLNCSSNLISSLDVSSNTNLTFLDCGGNNLSTLDVTSCTNIQTLRFYGNTISSIDLSDTIALTTLEASSTNLTSLDLSNNSQLVEVYMTENTLLTYVSLKNGSLQTIVFFNQSPNIQFVCVDDNEIPFIVQQLDIALVPNAVVNSYCSFTPGGNYNTITGNISYDFNTNGCDANDIIQPNVRIDINDGTMQGATFTDANGNYTFYTQTGTFNISPSINNPALFAISPATSSITFSDNNNNTISENFCMTGIGVSPDVEITIAPIDPARPGFNAKYDVVINNKGNQIISGTIDFNFDDTRLDFIDASEIPASQNNGLITWNYINLLPFESRNITVTLNVNSPVETPAVNNGDVLNFLANVNPIATDIIPADNTYTFNQTVVGSFDPNDIICLEGETVSPSEIGSYLRYVINFENTGTYQAENIVVKDEIDLTKFDINSLQLLNTSHNAYTRITGNKVEFIFEGINLAATSGSPPVGGHGNVLFKIRSKNNLVTGDSVQKRANIYFDYNAPITTNMAVTTFQTLNNSIFEFDNSIQVYPNPTVSIINIKSNHSIKSIELYDIQGRILETSLENSKESTLDISKRETGIYFLKIITEEGSKVEKIMKE